MITKNDEAVKTYNNMFIDDINLTLYHRTDKGDFKVVSSNVKPVGSRHAIDVRKLTPLSSLV